MPRGKCAVVRQCLTLVAEHMGGERCDPVRVVTARVVAQRRRRSFARCLELAGAPGR